MFVDSQYKHVSICSTTCGPVLNTFYIFYVYTKHVHYPIHHVVGLNAIGTNFHFKAHKNNFFPFNQTAGKKIKSVCACICVCMCEQKWKETIFWFHFYYAIFK